MTTNFDKLILEAPRTSGVYLMKDAAGKIIYVGKAKDLRARLRNYAGGTDTRGMIPFLLSRVRDVEWILTATEKEALILENNLIKEHRPRYNVDFRDDKAYFHLRMDTAAPFPRFQLVRRPRSDGARYFGPYPSSGAAKETLRFLQTVFPLRTCRDMELRSRRRPCLEYQIGRCLAPCVRFVDEETYRQAVRDALIFMEGRETELLEKLAERMHRAAAELQFEAAAALRDRIGAIRTTLEKQRTAVLTAKDQDVFGVCREGDLTQLCLLRVRAGKMVGMQSFPLIRINLPTADIIAAALVRYYDAGHEIPGEILLAEASEDREVIADWLGEKRGRTMKILIPKRGQGRALIEMGNCNAAGALKMIRQRVSPEEAGNHLAKALGLRKLPERIECFDISNISGRYAVGSMVTFVRGVPWRDGYRRFRIRSVSGADDYGMMYEVLKRRYAGGENLPDLLVVDGGKGQLSVALSVLKDLKIGAVDVIALAKGRNEGEDETGDGWRRQGYLYRPGEKRGEAPERERMRRKVSRPEGGRRPDSGSNGEAVREGGGSDEGKIGDRVFMPGRKEALNLARRPAALFLLQRLRDEAHRFAVSYHRKVRAQEDFSSLLDNIPGLGPEKKKVLLKGLEDMGRISVATIEDLQQLPGIGKGLSARIAAYFAGKEDHR